MPRHIGTCFRLYTQMRVEKKTKHLPIVSIVTSHNSEPTDFNNVIVENIPPALFEDAEVAEVKRPRNSKRRKFYYEKS